MRTKIETTPHPMPCAGCGRATRVLVDGRRTCYVCLGTTKERKAS